MKPHPDFESLQKLFPAIETCQALATKHGIHDIFQDNGGKILQVCLALGLMVLPGREGNDAKDNQGNEYEIKTLNILKQKSFTTHHHLNPMIIQKYRKVDWIFATYEGIVLKAIYHLRPDKMAYWYGLWEAKWRTTQKDINNPKIPLKYVLENGQLVFRARPLSE